MKFSTVFGFATLFVGAFAAPAASDETALAAKRGLLDGLTADASGVESLVGTITSDLEAAVSAGNLTAYIPELVTELGEVASGLTKVISDLASLNIIAGLTDLTSLLGLGLSTIGTIISILGSLISTVTALVNTLLSTTGLESELGSLLGSGAATALSTALSSVISQLTSISSAIPSL